MTRVFHGLAAWTGYFALALAAIAAAQALNLIDTKILELSGQAIMIAERRGTVASVVTAYPPLPLLVSIPFVYLTPAGALPAAVASAFIAAVFAASLFQSLRYRNFSWTASQTAVLCVAASPLFFHALTSGPGAIMLLIATMMLAHGLFGLGERGSAPHLMMTGVALLLMAFMHPLGMILAAACVPALAMVAPPQILARTPGSLFLMLAFPLVFALLAFGYVRWLFGADPFGFMAMAGSPVIGDSEPTTSLAASTLRALLAVILAAPLISAFFVWTRRRQQLTAAGTALAGLLAGAVLLQIIIGGHGDRLLILAACLPVAAVCAMHAPRSRVYELYICILLLAGVAGGGVVVQAYAAPDGMPASPSRQAAARTEVLQLSEILRQAEGLLIDTDAHPEFVAARGTAKGLIVPGEADFELQLQSRHLTSNFIAISHDEKSLTPDRVTVTFPGLYDSGAPGYRLVYNRGGWRVYARLASERGHK